MNRAIITIGGIVAALSLSACAASSTDWRTELSEAMEAMVAAEGDLDDSSLCEENPLFGGPEEQKALMLSMSTATLPEGQTVGEARAAGDALGGALGDVESSAPTTPEEEHLIAVSETIPDETPSAEVMTAVVDGMFAHCGI